MFLVDTSVWIDYLREKDNPAVLAFKEILDQGVGVGITGLIFQEVLQGARGETDFQTLAAYLQTQRFYHPADPIESYRQAAALYFQCRRKGMTVRSSNDCLIAQIAIENDLILLHNDRDFTAMGSVITDLQIA